MAGASYQADTPTGQEIFGEGTASADSSSVLAAPDRQQHERLHTLCLSNCPLVPTTRHRRVAIDIAGDTPSSR
jgi:hypothetical protein